MDKNLFTQPRNGIIFMLRRTLDNLIWLCVSRSNIHILYLYLVGMRKKLLHDSKARRLGIAAILDSMGTFTARWFDVWAPELLTIFEQEKMTDKSLHVLEIGAFEGRSTCFFLHYLPSAKVTCVDPWEPYCEVKGGTEGRVEAAEKLFDQNISGFIDRLEKFKGTSVEYYATQRSMQCFDIIYVDGSHFGDDVLIDALYCFSLLKDDGIMLFDDFIYAAYEHVKHNTTYAINLFLRLKSEEIKIIGVPGQLYIKKKKGRSPKRRG